MTEPSSAIDLSPFVRAGDRILWAQGAGEPTALTTALVDQRARLGGVEVFLGVSFSETLQPEHADHIRFRGLGGFGTNVGLSLAGVLEVVPCHLSAVPALIEQGHIGVDVVFLQVSPADARGRHSLGVAADYVWSAIRRARVVLAEINDQTPRTRGETEIDASAFTAVVHAAGGPVEVSPTASGPVEQAIGDHVAERIVDGSVLQFGIGATPDAIAEKLHDRRDLGIHTGLLGDRVLDLIESGAVNNRCKPIDRGVTVAGLLVGTRRLYNYAHENPALQLRPATYTHSAAVLGKLTKFVAINSAVEVDLTGQVNAEVVGGVHIGAVGGAVDFMRGAAAAQHGRAIVALPSTARDGTVSRIVARSATGVTTAARSDVDLVVTEFGVAELRGRSIGQRARALAKIAHPAFRDELLFAAPALT
jgi:acyl-CoA hydrolase